MADYQLRARIPQETADKLFTVIKELQEKTEVADVTTSSVTRAALEDFIRKHDKKILNIEIDNSLLNDDTIEDVTKALAETVDKFDKDSPEKKVLLKVYYAMYQERIERLTK